MRTQKIVVAILCFFLCQQVFAEKESNPIFQSTLKMLEIPVPNSDAGADTENDMKPYDETIPGTDQKFKMIPIPGGKFVLGGKRSDERKETEVEIGKETPTFEIEIKPFWIEEHETTWKEFSQYALKWLRTANAANPSAKNDERAINADAMACPTNPWDISSISYDNSSKDNFPASGMTQYCAAAYCKWLTQKTGRYYRLPTEAEWEYACRAGSVTDYSFGDDADELENFAWFFDNCDEGYKRIKGKKPNNFGLYDMHGNVAEWVIAQYSADSYDKLSKGLFPLNVIPAKGEFGQIARGGSSDHEAEECLSSTRIVFVKNWKEQDPQFPKSIWWVTNAPFVGFRVVRPLDPPKTDAEAALFDPNPETWKEYSELNTRE